MFAEASQRSVFLSREWFLNLDRTVEDAGAVTKIYGVESERGGDGAIGALLLRYPRARRIGIIPRVARGLSNYYTALYGPVLREHNEERACAVQLFVEALCNERREWDVLDLRPLDREDPVYADLRRHFQSAGCVSQAYFCFGNWHLQVDGRSYAEYVAGLPTVLRKNIPYYARKLERSARVRYELVTSLDGLESALRDYEKVYNVSWREKAEPYPDFIPGLVRTAAKQGWLRLGLLYLNDEPAAAQLWLVHGGTASIYKICYDERFAKLSVGTVLTARMMQQALDIDRVGEVDYLGGDEPYKRDWMSHRRERWGLMVFNPSTVRGLSMIVRHVGGRGLKRLIQRIGPAGMKDTDTRPKSSM
ncbi:GNAT family N-acetyltransferase [Nitrospira moscoviensis]|uniref:GNAT family N-acetyltransferase n=1 Tax=Nitrospira moscoviensis TaxID=42253 RepID=UPI0006A7A205|nr:GNAT family N-acetyltransferase [Nitrospira moscoviensis]